MNTSFKSMLSALTLLLCLSLLTGGVYPLLVTGVAQLLSPQRAQGSLVLVKGHAIGSTLIGQSFTSTRYFWSRPSATTPEPYNGLASTGSNLGPMNPALLDTVKARIAALRDADPGKTQPVPVDLVTASASGLDPHISLAAAVYQAPRVAQARGLSIHVVQQRISEHTHSRWLGQLGEPYVNVLQLNLALDALH